MPHKFTALAASLLIAPTALFAQETAPEAERVSMSQAIKAAQSSIDGGVLEAEVETEGDEAIGVQILARALTAPLQQIADNRGEDGAVIADAVNQLKGSKGYDASQGDFVDMLESGILDPTKVVRSALTHAASIAGLMLTTQVLVTKTDDADGKAQPAVQGAVR